MQVPVVWTGSSNEQRVGARPPLCSPPHPRDITGGLGAKRYTAIHIIHIHIIHTVWDAGLGGLCESNPLPLLFVIARPPATSSAVNLWQVPVL